MAGLLKKVFGGVFGGGGGDKQKERSRRGSGDSQGCSATDFAPMEDSLEPPPVGKPLPGGFGVRVAVPQYSGGPLLCESPFSSGGIQGLHWYCLSLHMDEEGEVATDFLIESPVSTTTGRESSGASGNVFPSSEKDGLDARRGFEGRKQEEERRRVRLLPVVTPRPRPLQVANDYAKRLKVADGNVFFRC